MAGLKHLSSRVKGNHVAIDWGNTDTRGMLKYSNECASPGGITHKLFVQIGPQRVVNDRSRVICSGCDTKFPRG